MKVGPFRRSLMRLFGVAATKAPPEKPPFDPNQQLKELIDSIIKDAQAKATEAPKVGKSEKVQAALDASLAKLKAEGHLINGVSIKKMMSDGSIVDVTAEYFQQPEPPTVIDGKSIDANHAQFSWTSWRAVLDVVQRAGWAACRFPIRIDQDAAMMVTGIVRGSFGIYLSAFPVCDDDEDEQVTRELACISHLRSGAAIGIFGNVDDAVFACEIAEKAEIEWIEIDPNIKETWVDSIGRLITAWQFNGIRVDDKRHAHAELADYPLKIYIRPASAILDGKPEVLS